ncbi:endospore germination permease [Salipaludibacillus agaradhaerens]|uniref:Endospore germination permease n=1 Tax=Salipaludibacillus agaradhaerens TaxID=76935 RepID=A0A9Q4B0M4_SALAG|nr:spore germination protein [Salipaludibacillus agaradhaerens]MCR6095847.1 endospore germination permease [Salipaludibacillus agaradhaerens]MCR6114593.1 endospore germination permease [Salipaludibacillus agaradhaerens]
MNKEKITNYQMFLLMVLFMLGSAVVVGLEMNSQQDAWLTILTGMVFGSVFFLLYGYIFSKHPGRALTSILEDVFGKIIGKLISIGYIGYFLYIAARVTRDFTDLIVIELMMKTPDYIIAIAIIIVVIYASSLGIEVIARTGQLAIIFLFGLGGLVIVFALIDQLPDFSRLEPVLEEGWGRILTNAFPVATTFPFGELIAFTMFFPFFKENKTKKVVMTGLSAIVVSGVTLASLSALIVAINAPEVMDDLAFPLLDAIKKINIADIIQRLDPIGILFLVIGGFYKISLFVYAANVAFNHVLKLKKNVFMQGFLAIVPLVASFYIAENFIEHLYIGLEIVPYYLHLVFQLYIPLLLIVGIWVRSAFEKKKAKKKAS